MLPGVSAMDCLVADLGLDPAPSGSQSYEATDFLVRRRVIDTGALLILWQVGFIGGWRFEPEPNSRALPLLVERLQQFYPDDHEAILYEASPYAVCAPIVQRLPIVSLGETEVPIAATLVVPPRDEPEFDGAMLQRVRQLLV
jgi:hypothetical protein